MLNGTIARPLRSVRSHAAPVVKTALLRMGAYGLTRGLAPSRRVAILRYHAICDGDGAWYADPAICISPDAFERHVRYLAANYTVLPLPEVVARIRGDRPLPRNCVAITFDDGYADNLEAARTLHEHGLSATFFITAGCLADGDPFWPAELRALLMGVTQPLVRLAVAGAAIEIPLTTPAARSAAVRTMTRLFKSHRIAVRESIRDQLRNAAAIGSMPRCMLRWDELAAMQRLGMTIGAHTLTHPNLPSAGIEAATFEIAGSKARLERELGEPVTMFSYPNGGAERYYTAELQRVVASSGFAAAASSRNAFAGQHSDLYALERVEVEERLEDLTFALEVERFAFEPNGGVAR